MALQLQALGVQTPEINPVQALAAGQQAGQAQQANQIQIAQANLAGIAQMAHNTGGDPAKWEQGLDMLETAGLPVQSFRGRADLAPIVAESALTAAQQVAAAQNEQEFAQRIREFELKLSEAAKGTADQQNFTAAQADPAFASYLSAKDAPNPPSGVAEYNFYAEQEKAAGRQPKSFGDFQAANKGGQTINVNNGGDNALDKALSEAEGKAWATYKEAATTSSSNSQDFDILQELLTQAPQGPVTGRLADTFKGFSAAGDAANSIIKRIAPTLRAPGSGATSDIEYNGMLQSLPSLAQMPEANTMVLSIMQAKAQINMERGRVISEYQSGDLTVDDARAKMDELNTRSIMTPDMKRALVGLGSDGEVGTPPPNVGEVVDGYTFNGGDPSSPLSWSKVN